MSVFNKLKILAKDELVDIISEIYKQTLLSERDVELTAAEVILRKADNLHNEIKSEFSYDKSMKLMKLYDKANQFLKLRKGTFKSKLED